MPVALGSAYGEIQIGTGGAERSVNSLADSMRRVGQSMSLAVTAPLLAVAGAGLKAAAGFETSMNTISVVSNATAAQMESMSGVAIKLGADTVFSAGEAAQGMLELAKAGLSAQESMEAIGGVLDLAAAGSIEVARAAEITANALNAFNLPASESARVADLLAAAANASSAEMTDLAQGLQQAGFIFNAAGQGVDDLAASLAILTNVGLTGSDAGTALKNAFTRIINPTKEATAVMNEIGVSFFDAAGNMKALPDIIDDLNVGLAGMTQEQRLAALSTIFLSDGAKALIPLLNVGKNGFLKMKTAVNEAGAAQKVADARMKGLAGAIEYAKGTIESALISAFLPLTEGLGETIRKAADLIGKFGDLPEPVRNAALAFAAVMAAVGPLLLALPMIGSVLAALLSPVGLIGLAVAGLAAAWAADFGGIREKTAAAIEGMRPAFDSLRAWLSVEIPNALATLQQVWAAVWKGITTGDWLDMKIVWVKMRFQFATLKQNITTWIMEVGPVIVEAVKGWATAFSDWVGIAWVKLQFQFAILKENITGWITTQGPILVETMQAWTTAFSDWATDVWEKLKPKLDTLGAEIVAWANGVGVKIGEETETWGQKLQEWTPTAAEVDAAIKPVGGDMAESILDLQETVGTSFGWMIGAAIGAIPRLVIGAVSTMVTSILGSINMAFAAPEAETELSTGIGGTVTRVFENIGKSFGAIGVGFWDQIEKAIGDPPTKMLEDEWAKFGENINSSLAITSINAMYESLRVWLHETLPTALAGFGTAWLTGWEKARETVDTAVAPINEKYESLRLWLHVTLPNALAGFGTAWAEGWAAAGTKLGDVWGAIAGSFESMRDWLENKLQAALNAFRTFIEGFQLPNPFAVWQGILDGISSKIAAIKAALASLTGGGGDRTGGRSGRGLLPALPALPTLPEQYDAPRGGRAYGVQASAQGAGAMTINNTYYVSDALDIEAVAYRVAQVIQRKGR